MATVDKNIDYESLTTLYLCIYKESRYCKTRKFHLRLIFTDEINLWKLNAAKIFILLNDIEGDCQWLVKIRWAKTFGLASQWKIISAKISSFTVI